MYKAYLKNKILFIAGLLLSMGIFNLFIDPYGIFNIMSIEGVNEIKTTKFRSRNDWATTTIDTIKWGGYDTLFLGSSRAHRGLNPAYLSPVYHAYNAAYPRSCFEDFYIILQPVFNEKRVKTVVIGIDFGMARTQNTLSVNNFKTRDVYDYLFGFYTSLDSFLTLESNFNKKQGTTTYLANGLKIKGMPEVKTNRFYKRHLNKMIKRFKRRKIFKTKLEQGHGWKFLRLIVTECKKNNIDLFLYFSPVHAELLEVFTEMGWAEDYKNLMRTVVQVANLESGEISGEGKIMVWDFSGYNTITTEPYVTVGDYVPMKWYFECSHYKPAVGNMVLDAILKYPERSSDIPDDFGILLTPENVEKRLTLMRQNRSRYLAERYREPGSLQISSKRLSGH